MTPIPLPGSAPRASHRRPWLLGALLLLGVVVIYRHVGEFGFLTFDDEHNIVFNPHMGPLSLDRVQWAFSDLSFTRRYMPLGWLEFATVFSFSGLNPAGYHLAGFGFHLANSGLFFVLLRRLAAAGRGAGAGAQHDWRDVVAFLGAAFWAWHPLRVEGVAWATALLYGQAEFFLLLALMAFERAPAERSGRICAWLAYGASLLTYPVAIGFAPVFALIAAWRLGDGRRALKIAVPFLAIAAAAVVLNLVARAHADAAFIPMPSWEEFPLSARIMQASYVWVYYAWIPLWPPSSVLFNPVLLGFNPWSPPFLLSAAVLVTAVGGCIFWAAARRRVGGWLLAHLCVLVPMMGWVERPYFPSDRYAAFTQGVLAAALVVGLMRLSVRRDRVIIALLALLAVVGWAAVSVRQVKKWRDAPTVLAQSTAGLAPGILPVMRFERPAVLLYRSGDTAGALALLDRGIAELPGDRSLRAAREDLVRQSRELGERIVAVGAPASTPPVAFLHQQVGLECARAGEWRAATEHLRLARLSAPDFYEPAYNLALVWLRRGETRSALGCYLWAEAHGGGYLPASARKHTLDLIADQFAGAGEDRLAKVVRARALSVGRD